jgi:cyclic-di-AMP phosphodiesterase PgpH
MMSKDPAKPGAKSNGRPQTKRRTRRRESPVFTQFKRAMASPNFGWGVTISVLFVVLVGSVASWTREQPLVAVGRVMDRTKLSRLDFELPDLQRTEDLRLEARNNSPRFYLSSSDATLAEIEQELTKLPQTLAGVQTLDELSDELREEFALTDRSLAQLKTQVLDGEPSPTWKAGIERLMNSVRRTPILDAEDWRDANQALYSGIKLQLGEETIDRAKGEEVSTEATEALRDTFYNLCRGAQIPSGDLRDAVVARLMATPTPTYRFDANTTREKQDEAAAAVEMVTQTTFEGDVIFKRGQTLTAAQHAQYRSELGEFRRAKPGAMWLERASVFAATAAVTAILAGYLGLFASRVRKRPARMIWIAVLLSSTLAVACSVSAWAPTLVMLSASAATVFVAAILVVAYDRRLAFTIASLYAVLICVTLNQPIGTYIVLIVGAGVAAALLKEIRDRRALIRMAMVTALALSVTTAAAGMIDRPMTMRTFMTTLGDAGFAAGAGLFVGALVWFILPYVERIFDITTGMTLIELRDPKQPLLRQLQQRAPGTYNHSLNVASISEAAADAIGADSLLTYVGALYHDIGKMNKPEYFVENQSGGPNKHDKLSPAMSLLVIVGHVKDGLEMAREFELPRPLHHFIEAHHGTTLVEYFFERAKKQALVDSDAGEVPLEQPEPEEIEYRYPGPRPRTKEVAIIMLADSVESATRTIAEPTPSRIDALVRDFANKRLLDGQFDECGLTLRELRIVSNSISKTVASIYHGRIAYPTGEKRA